MHINPRYIITRITQLGLSGLAQVLTRNVNKKIFALIYKKKALSKSAFFSWQKIARKNKFPLNFDTFLAHVKQSTYIDYIQEHELFKQVLPDEYKNLDWIPDPYFVQVTSKGRQVWDDDTKPSRLYCHPELVYCHPELVSGSKPYSPINWHEGFEDKVHTFYQDIKIPSQKAKTFDQNFPDIKKPWDLSRFQHMYVLAHAYKNTQNPELAQIFEAQINSWLKHNPYLLGVNWVCPMDVAIRAVNLIWGFHAFKNAPNIKPEFWEKLTCSLYAHAIYLESNWETSDKPNNHYLADLTGYYYLCHFFDNSPKFQKKKQNCFNKIYTQYNTQILPDGTCWEGSTAYHKLDTEMLLHVLLLHEFAIPGSRLHKKLSHMLTFLQDCTDTNNNFVTIGDNDSGKLVTGIRTQYEPASPGVSEMTNHENMTQKKLTYPDFGLTIIKNKNWHITLKNNAYKQAQPTGHFHQDENAITLSINGQPILIDTGSYVYTANSKWRNYFRSYDQHSTFYIHSQEDLEAYDLFQLQKKDVKKQPETLQRKVTLDTQTKTLILDDSIKVSPETSSIKSSPPTLTWTFIFSPTIALVQDNKSWLILVHQKPIALIKSSLNFSLEPSFYSPAYGTKVPCQKLVATKVYAQTEQTIFHAL